MTLSNARLCFGSYLNDNDNRQSNFMINIVLRMQVIVQIFKKLGSKLILSEICAVLQLSLVQLSLSSDHECLESRHLRRLSSVQEPACLMLPTSSRHNTRNTPEL